jgi:asparagine synthase (glutamine-hydrolysing)
MCGIAGFVGEGNRENLEKMISEIKHRGPDSRGVEARDNVGFAHTRLAILDLTPLGHQPMWSNDPKDNGVCVVFNGEIYNFQELKKDLEEKGRVFRGTSDTEVILALYEEEGERVFEKLEGMFAIGLYDFKRKKLLLARDRMGKKPLYWCFVNGTLLFASELKALAAHPLFKKEIDIASLNKYFFYDYIPTPHTIFKNVFKLEPATFLVFENGKITQKKFWQMNTVPQNSISFHAALSLLDEKMNHAVATRLVADVPVGIFLSGGLDSSTVAYYAQKNSQRKVKTFSIGFLDESFDESEYAEDVARFLGTEHLNFPVKAEDLLDIIPRVVEMTDEPMADASIIPTFILSRHTREHVTVALGGDGGDELFAGYPTFQAEIFASSFRKFPLLAKEAFRKFARARTASPKNFSLEFIMKKFLDGADELDIAHRHQKWLGTFGHDDRAALFTEDVWGTIGKNNVFEDTDRYMKEWEDVETKNALLMLYQRTYMMDEVLVKVDRASMANGLEVRAPFLDAGVVELANSLPYSSKHRGLTGKYILKKLMNGKLPPHIVHRQKKGFGVPIGRWFRDELKDFCNTTLSEDSVKRTGLLNAAHVESLKSEHFSGAKDHRKKLWSLVIFMMWHEKYMK